MDRKILMDRTSGAQIRSRRTNDIQKSGPKPHFGAVRPEFPTCRFFSILEKFKKFKINSKLRPLRLSIPSICIILRTDSENGNERSELEFYLFVIFDSIFTILLAMRAIFCRQFPKMEPLWQKTQ